jgi:DNA-binding CsgD family transcriptional regulator
MDSSSPPSDAASSTLRDQLTPIERKAARLLSIGQPVSEIAWTLGLADHEVVQLQDSIQTKTGCLSPLDLWRVVNNCEPWKQDVA